MGDINGDGLGDLIVSAVHASHHQRNEGAVVSFHGSYQGLGSKLVGCFESDRTDFEMGTELSRLGDINGDGFCDTGIVANRIKKEGHIFVLFGGPHGFWTRYGWRTGKPISETIKQWDRQASLYDKVMVYGGGGSVFLMIMGRIAYRF